MRLGRLALVAALVALAFAATFAQADAPYIDETRTECWKCHSAWPEAQGGPMTSFYDVIPPQPSAINPGSEFEYTISVFNPWLHEVRQIQPVLDLTNAPSLQFGAGEPAIEGQLAGSGTIDLTYTPDPTNPIANPFTTEARGHAVVVVPEGATSLTLTAELDPNGNQPDITMYIFPGRTSPVGDPEGEPINDAGPGGAESYSADAATMARLGSGNWTVQLEILTLNPANGDLDPTFTNTEFDVIMDAEFGAGERRTLALTRSLVMEPNGATLFTWPLEAISLPGEGETIGLTVNGTIFYKHPPNVVVNDDWGNATKYFDLEVLPDETAEHLLIVPPLGPQTGSGQAVVVSLSLVRISEAVGYASAFLLIASIVTGGIFGKATRRGLNKMFGSAKRRVSYHNFISYGLTAAALAHMIIFLVDLTYHWTLGIIWGGLGILAMFLLGITGALQVPMIRRWNYGLWRWSHFALAIASILFTLIHIGLDGANFDFVQEAVGWEDPFGDPRGV